MHFLLLYKRQLQPCYLAFSENLHLNKLGVVFLAWQELLYIMGLHILFGVFLDLWHLVLGIPGPVINQLMEVSCECTLVWQINSRCLVLVMALSVLFSHWTCGTCLPQLIFTD